MIEICYAQTHQLCTYNIELGNPFSDFVEIAIYIWLMLPLFIFASLVIVDLVLKIMTSQISQHKHSNNFKDSQ
jgi:hypothetical protein